MLYPPLTVYMFALINVFNCVPISWLWWINYYIFIVGLTSWYSCYARIYNCCISNSRQGGIFLSGYF